MQFLSEKLNYNIFSKVFKLSDNKGREQSHFWLVVCWQVIMIIPLVMADNFPSKGRGPSHLQGDLGRTFTSADT